MKYKIKKLGLRRKLKEKKMILKQKGEKNIFLTNFYNVFFICNCKRYI